MTGGGSAVAAALAAAAGVLLLMPNGRPATERLRATSSSDREGRQTRGSDVLRLLSASSAGLVVATYIGGTLGLGAGLGAALAVNRWLRRLPEPHGSAEARRRQFEQPLVTDLLAACLASGAGVQRSLNVVSGVATSGVKGELDRVAGALAIGAAPVEAWALVLGTDLAPMAAVMGRSATTGAPASYLLQALAREQRAAWRSRSLSDARRLGVRVAGPLGLCFLPAFILVGVIPLVLSLVHSWS